MKVRAADIEIDYRLEGPEDAPVVVLIHSLATNHEAWADVAADLAADFRVLRYSLRGHGETEATPGPYSMELLADDLAALLDVLGIARVHLVGLSIGGMIGQTFAIRHPNRLDKLIICSSLSELPDGADAVWQERIAAARRDGMEGQVEATVERWFTAGFLAGDSAAPDKVREMIRGTSLDGYLACCMAIQSMNLTSQIATVAHGTLVLVGADDLGTPPASAQVIADAIPRAELRIIEDASHQLALQQPDAFIGSVRGFLEDGHRPS